MALLRRARFGVLALVFLSGVMAEAGIAKEGSRPGDDKASDPVAEEGSENWITSDDYPLEVLSQGVHGTVAVDLTISPQGIVSGCAIETSSGSPDLDAVTCTLLTARARFTPAKNSRGAPTVGHYQRRVRWVIPVMWTAIPAVAPDDTSLQGVIVRAHVTADGVLDQCWVIASDEEREVPPQFSTFQERVCAQARSAWSQRPGSMKLSTSGQWLEWRNFEIAYEGVSPWLVPTLVDNSRTP